MINRNGGALLRDAVASCRVSLEAAWRARPDVEFVFVDNGSTDDSVTTAQEMLKGVSFPWSLVQESTPGVNAARNAGLKAARGELLVYTDSDLRFSTGWLQAYQNAARRFPDIEVFAGRVRIGPIGGPVPNWLDLCGPYRRTAIIIQMDAGEDARVLPLDNAEGVGPVGPNMAFRRSVFDHHGSFDTRFGLRPGSLVPGAEAEYFDRLARAKFTFVYVPDAVVHHPLRADQMTKKYFLTRLHGIGRVNARLQRIRGANAKRLFGVTLYAFEYLLRSSGMYVLSFLQFSLQRRFFYRGEMARWCGHLHEDWLDRGTARPGEPGTEKSEIASLPCEMS